jgi:hypothetical protein
MGWREDYANFDLGRFTLAGWLVFVGSIVVGVAMCIGLGFACVALFPAGQQRQFVVKCGAVVALGAVVGSFFALKAILHSFGVVLIRPKLEQIKNPYDLD